MTTPRILLIGGHGKVSLLLTPLLLSRYNLTSLIRSETQKSAILALQKDNPGKVDVLVGNLEDVKSEGDAREILKKVGAGWVVWCAGECGFSGGGSEVAGG